LFYIHATINRLVNREGNLSTMVGFQEDITEQKKMEEERIKADKIESLGILAGGIAHDFNNILTSILGNISLAKLVSDKDDKSHDLLNDAEKASLRAKDLTNQLLTFSKGGAPVKKTASIQQIIEDTARFSLRGSNVKCCNFIPKNLWFVKVDVGQISQVISNLVINAYQAMPAGGVINIKAENIIVGPESLLPLNQGKYVKISIRDQGTGITRKYLSKIFDPYFTTKQKSSGLGLATAYSILKKHAGHIAVESELEVGTTFHVYLPASADKFRGNEPVKEEIPVRKSKVLIMDDDEAVRVTATRIIKKIGHEVAVSADGAEAMELYINARESNRPYDIVILDLTVPGGMGGREAVKQLLKIDPQVKAIVSSGYSTDPVLSNFAEYGFSGIITKPYNVEEMRELLNKVTGDSGD
ncbi:MAG: ATP-binding protein, partial [Gemmatimonadota bacterium]|nr:ATP-binding protein [Gemmatimonadota bacterium]